MTAQLNPILPTKLHADAADVVVHDVDVERDEITQLVMRLKRADDRQRTPLRHTPAPSVAAQTWAEDWQLPREVHDYFTLESSHA